MNYLLKVKKKVTQFEKKKQVCQRFNDSKYRTRIVKPKKGKGSFKREKENTKLRTKLKKYLYL